MFVYKQEFTVDFNYPVYFLNHIFDSDNSTLVDVIDRLRERRKHKVLVYIDKKVSDCHQNLLESICKYFAKYSSEIVLVAEPQLIEGGEKVKQNWQIVKKLIDDFRALHMCRQSFIIAVGGGSLLDMAGFATSLAHRGLRLIRMPTTVLAQNDAGVGVKNGINGYGVKNFIGTFAPPFAVINDFSFLRTLAMRDWTGGIAEAFKVAIIKDCSFFKFLCNNALSLYNRDQTTMEKLVKHCAMLHLDHIKNSKDPFEFGTARPLDFGHWLAHRLEKSTFNKLGHGQAVSIGIAVDSYYSMKKKLITEECFENILTGLSNSGLPVWDKFFDHKDCNTVISRGLDEFREHLGGKLTITLPNPLGKKIEVHKMDKNLIMSAVNYLKNWALKKQLQSVGSKIYKANKYGFLL